MKLRELKDVLTDCDKQLNENDWIEVESKLNCTIPADLKRFYESCNGGIVKESLILINGNERIEIRAFIPARYNKFCPNDPNATMEGMTLAEKVNQSKDCKELIVGVAWDGKRICVNSDTGVVNLYPVIGFDNDNCVYGTPIFVSSSFDQFISMLRYEPDVAESSQTRIERTSKEKLLIESSARMLSPEDWLEFEKRMNFKIPASMKSFYLKNNGGMPNLNFFLPQNEDMDEVEINTFLPIKYPLKGVQTIEDTCQSLWDRNMIPKIMLPFAIDSGNNLYAIHKKTLCIYYIVMDIWHEEWSCEENFEANSTKIASSFRYFVSHLLPEE